MGRRLLAPENREVGQKLGMATLCMLTLPVLTFYIAQHVFRNMSEPDDWAGGAAILMTNLVVGGYCYMAYIEDLNDDTTNKAGEKQQQPNDNDASTPRVGIYKQRTD